MPIKSAKWISLLPQANSITKLPPKLGGAVGGVTVGVVTAGAGAVMASVTAATDMALATAGAGDVVGAAGTGKQQPLVSLIN